MYQKHVRQRRQFREEEVSKLLKWARAGESASIIGISGVGKSNLFNHLLDIETQQAYLGTSVKDYLFVRVNFHYIPDFTNRSLYSVILEQFELLDGRCEQLNLTQAQLDQLSSYHDQLLEAGDDVLKVQRYFKLAIRLLLRESERRIVFLFDQFDEVYQEADGRFFANLRGLREAYKYRISYFTFTRGMLSRLAEMDPAREEFSELLLGNVIGLGPYNAHDALSLLERVSSRIQLPPSEEQAARLLHLSGGHAGVLKSVYLAVAQDGLALVADEATTVAALLTIPNVETECAKIWNSVRLDERKLLARLAHGAALVGSTDAATLYELQIKGLVSQTEPFTIFCPIFAHYARHQEALWERPLYLEPQSRQVWVLGTPTEPLTALEYKLFSLLYERIDEIVDKDELIEAGWPGTQGGVSDQALTAAMYRLRRKIEPDPKQTRFLDSLRGQGYQLHSS
ncbi:MAG: winged helix-turn-helix domain-containing protein [Ardenticatenaceae bacterium]|nr:winged helix-turn-helix domain-containing protein [Ardenticatenaceae bacterium]